MEHIRSPKINLPFSFVLRNFYIFICNFIVTFTIKFIPVFVYRHVHVKDTFSGLNYILTSRRYILASCRYILTGCSLHYDF